MAHELRSMSVFICLVDIRDIHLLRTLQQGKYVVDVGRLLVAEVFSAGVAVVSPALRLHDQ